MAKGALALGGALAGGIAGGAGSEQISSVQLGPQSGFSTLLGGADPQQIASAELEISQLQEALSNGSLPSDQRAKLQSQLSSTQNRLQNLQSQGGALQDLFGQLQGLVGAGPGQADVTAGLGAQRDLAAMLQGLTETGGVPGQEDIATAGRFAGDIFAGRETALRQQFEDEAEQANIAAAGLGRDINDPILRAQLVERRGRLEDVLGAEKQGFTAQFALGLPQQRLGFAAQRAGILGDLGSQALSNRAALFGMGNQALNAERQFRLASATRTTEQPGSFGGALTGAIGGAGAGVSLANAFQTNTALKNFNSQFNSPAGGGGGAGGFSSPIGPTLPGGSFYSGQAPGFGMTPTPLNPMYNQSAFTSMPTPWNPSANPYQVLSYSGAANNAFGG